MADMSIGTQLGGAAIALFIVREVFTFIKGRTNGNGASGYLCKEVDRLGRWTGNQEGRVRALEVGREGMLVKLEAIEKEQSRSATALESLTSEVRKINGR